MKRKRLRNALRHQNPTKRELRQWRGVAVGHGVEVYIEFNPQNFGVYSIELAHLLFTAASEVDVIAKLLCRRFAPDEPCENINHYRHTLLGC